MGRSRKGAWIEIITRTHLQCWLDSRSRKGAWIEIALLMLNLLIVGVAPVRERGLKYVALQDTELIVKSLP